MRLGRTMFGWTIAGLLATAVPAAAASSPHVRSAHPNHHAMSAHSPVLTDAEYTSPFPDDGPPALYNSEPALPTPKGWPAGNPFSRTSGTGRTIHEGYYWTDWLYDDHGTTTASPGGIAVTAGSPSFGTYTYPPGPAHGNGADIFRAAFVRRSFATYWRVDWTTLASASVPIAEWTFDTDDNASTGGSNWPGGAGVQSPGIETALIMSSHGAKLISVPSGHVIAHLPVAVDMAAQSFVTRVPRDLLPTTGNAVWRIRLGAGLADANGTGFARPPNALPTQPALYNVTFRRIDQEPVAGDYWDDMAQTAALRTGNVTTFSHVVRWLKLGTSRNWWTPQPRPRGWSDRWYVSAVKLGSGVLTNPSTIADGQPNYLGRVQPYAVYVPSSYAGPYTTSLTFLLHSLTQNQNQYAATTPKFTRLACEERHSICVTTLGRGPDGDYWDYAELDFWQVWHQIVLTYQPYWWSTVLCGYSMGGLGTNQLAMAHPDLFAKAVTLAGAVGDVPALSNLRWVPMYLAGGVTDELVPLTIEKAEADRLAALGNRYRWVIYPAVDHVAFELADSFADAARYMGNAEVVQNPGKFSFMWVPSNGSGGFSDNQITGGGMKWTQMPKYGVGTTGDYWLWGLAARSQNRAAKIDADSGMRPDRAITTHSAQGVAVDGPGPGIASELTWTRGKRPAARPVIRLHLTNVKALTILRYRAGFHRGQIGTLRVSSDGPTTIHFGRHEFRVHKGENRIHFAMPPKPKACTPGPDTYCLAPA